MHASLSNIMGGQSQAEYNKTRHEKKNTRQAGHPGTRNLQTGRTHRCRGKQDKQAGKENRQARQTGRQARNKGGRTNRLQDS